MRIQKSPANTRLCNSATVKVQRRDCVRTSGIRLYFPWVCLSHSSRNLDGFSKPSLHWLVFIISPFLYFANGCPVVIALPDDPVKYCVHRNAVTVGRVIGQIRHINAGCQVRRKVQDRLLYHPIFHGRPLLLSATAQQRHQEQEQQRTYLPPGSA